MKTNQTNLKSKQGSALIVTLSIVSIAVLVLASYLIMVQSQVASVSRSQTWNSAISLAEAGMEEGMAMVNVGSPSIIVNPYAWTNSMAGTGWSSFNGTNTSLTRYISGSNGYTVTIGFSSTNAPTVTSAGIVQYTPIPWVFSSSGFHPFLAQIGNQQTTTAPSAVNMGRKIQVSTKLSPLFSVAIVTKTNFDMHGNNATVDSFDSSTATYSTGGQYDSTKREAHGDVGTDSAVVGDISVGQGNIYGNVYTGPGSAQSVVQIGNNGLVGDLNWSSGIQPGHWAGNFNVNIPDVQAPNTTGWSTTLPVSNGSNVLNGGSYVVASVQHNIIITGPTVLWVQGSLSTGLSIAPGGSLILYVGTTSGSGDSLSLSGNNGINQPGIASNLQMYGLPSLTSISMSGNAAWTGTIYAPEADFTGGGGGNNVQDCSGAIIVNSITLNGHWHFHYDEALKNSGPSRGWIATGWKEVPYTP